MAEEIDFLGTLGTYWDEPPLRRLLAQLDIDQVPKRRAGNQTGFLHNHALGIELTFKLEDWLDVRLRAYPKRGLVLCSIRFYAEPVNRFQPYAGELPLGLSFGMPESALLAQLGAPSAVTVLRCRTLRFDRPNHCVFADLTPARTLATTDLQLPVVRSP